MAGEGALAIPDQPPRPAWRSPAAWTLVLLVCLLHFARLGEPRLRGEEPRRGRIAYEMVRSGDYFVPRQQGELHLSRPPLHNWAIAACAAVRGRTDAISIRFTSALALLLTALALFGYGRRVGGELAGFAAGAAYASMAQVLEIGARGETEALFALWVSGSLLVWHLGARRGPLDARTWMLAYALVGLGTITKGPQAPVYFGLAAAGWLLARRRWRELFRPAHFAGLAVFAAVFGAWLVPFWLRTDFGSVRAIFTGDVGLRFVDTSAATVATNLAVYPIEVLVSTLPWSLLLLAYLSPRFRRGASAGLRDAALFCGIAIAVSFPTVWIPPGSRPRYYFPLYPILATLAGLVVARGAAGLAEDLGRRTWRAFLALCVVLMVAFGPALAALNLFAPEGSPAVSPWVFVVAAGGAAWVLAAVAWRARAADDALAGGRGALAVAGFMGLAITGLVTDIWVRDTLPLAPQVEALRAKLPRDVELTSLGELDPFFAHCWGDFVPSRFIPSPVLEAPEGVEYFCFSPRFAHYRDDDLRFDWEPIATVICDIRPREVPQRPVIVGRVIRHPHD